MLYTIIGTVTSVDASGAKVQIKGTGNYLFVDENSKTEYNVLCAATSKPETRKVSELFDLNIETISQIILATAMVNQKSLKFKIDKKNSKWTITSISIPNV